MGVEAHQSPSVATGLIRLLLLLCPNRSVCILIKSDKFSFSEMLRKELYL